MLTWGEYLRLPGTASELQSACRSGHHCLQDLCHGVARQARGAGGLHAPLAERCRAQALRVAWRQTEHLGSPLA